MRGSFLKIAAERGSLGRGLLRWGRLFFGALLVGVLPHAADAQRGVGMKGCAQTVCESIQAHQPDIVVALNAGREKTAGEQGTAGPTPASEQAAELSSGAELPSGAIVRSALLTVLRKPFDGEMAYLGIYESRGAAETAWRDFMAHVPQLAEAQPVVLAGFVPRRGDVLRLYARTSPGDLPSLCALLNVWQAGLCEIHRFYH